MVYPLDFILLSRKGASQLSRVSVTAIPKKRHSYPENVTAIPNFVTAIPKMRHSYPEFLGPFSKKCHSYPEKRHSYPEQRHSYPEKRLRDSRKMSQLSRNCAMFLENMISIRHEMLLSQ